MMKRYSTVDDYILGHPEWQPALELLRELLLANRHLKEAVKWGAPIYTVEGKNVIGIGAFKAYVGLWFHQGVFLKDNAKVLFNAQEGKTKALRQWRFKSIDQIVPIQVREYIEEAVRNQLAGMQVKPTQDKKFTIPQELQNLLEADERLFEQFVLLSPFKQKEYAEYINTAKRIATKQSRLDKISLMIREGKGLNDKYR